VFLAAAARRHDITLLTGGLEPGETTTALEALGIDVRGVSWQRRPAPSGRLALVWRLLTARAVIEFWQKTDAVVQLRQAVRQAEREERYDLVQVTLGEIAPVVAAARAVSALFLFDVYGRQVDREVANAPTPRHRLLWHIEARKAHRWERRWYPQADSVACVTALDAAAIDPVLARPARVVPVPLSDEFFDVPSVARSTDAVAIIGMLNYRPNIDALLWFTSEVWPLIVAKCPGARLQVVGRAPVEEVRSAVAEAGGELLADVPDARPYYWGAAVVPVPMRLGSGMRNKVLHAIATGAPLVATSTAIEGIGLQPDEHLLVADGGAADFAAKVVQCLEDRDNAFVRAQAARRFCERYRIDKVAEVHDEWWQSAAGLGATT
jgi:glycosyltransferase involved in cell wall biosynthesis